MMVLLELPREEYAFSLYGARFLVQLNSSNNVLNSQHANKKAHSSLGSSRRANTTQTKGQLNMEPIFSPIPYGSTLNLSDRSLKIRGPVLVKRAEFIRDRKTRTISVPFFLNYSLLQSVCQ